jgi:benzodiazapine receptor
MASHRIALLLFLALVVGGGLAIGFLNAPGDWYSGLAKPSFTPPGWLFGPVWTAIYAMIAFAGWRVWRNCPSKWPVRTWWAQLVLNFLWSPVFFSSHQIGLALVIIVLLLVIIVSFIAATWVLDRVAALLFLPYAAWIAFATTLNFSIFNLN